MNRFHFLKAVLLTILCLPISNITGQFQELDEQFSNYSIIKLKTDDILERVRNQRSTDIKLTLLGEDLRLEVSEIISANYQVKIVSEKGSKVERGTTVVPTHGKTKDGRTVSLTFNENFVYGFIDLKNGDRLQIEPLYHFVNQKFIDTYVTYKASEIKETAPKTCGVTNAQRIGKRGSKGEIQKSSMMVCKEIQYAIANDFQMYQAFGNNSTNVQQHAIGVTNDIQTNYDNEFNDELQFSIEGQFVSTCSNCDPWTNTTNAGDFLDSFTSWGPTGFGFTHDIGSIWTNRDFAGSTIGIAWVGTVCTNLRYNALQNFTSNANTKRVMVAHELGHNFDCDHDGSGSPTIMAPSVNNTTTWSLASQNSVNAFVPTRTCLGSCVGAAPLVAGFTANNTQGCAPRIVQFFDESTGNITSRSWSFLGGTPSTSTALNPVITYNNPGSYNVTLTVFAGNQNNVAVEQNYVNVLDFPIADFDFQTFGMLVDFYNESIDANSFSWNFGDGATSTASDPTHEYAEDGVYEVTLTSANLCGIDTRTITVVIATPPLASFSVNNPNGCLPNSTFNFENLSSSNSNSYFWEFEGGTPATSTQLNPSVVYSTPGAFNVKLTVTNAQGIDIEERVDYINIYPTPLAQFTKVVNGNIATFTNQSTGATSFLWNFGDGNTSTQTNPTHTYAQAGSYNVTLQAISAFCPSHTVSSVVAITFLPTTAFSANTTSGCNPLIVNFSNLSGNNPTSYMWTFEGGTPSTSSMVNPTVTYANPGSFMVTLVATNAQGSSTFTQTNYISVATTPTANFNFTKTTGTVNFMNSGSAVNTSLWNFGDGNSSTSSNPVHTFSQEGTYTVTLINSNQCGNDTSSQTITVTLPPIAQALFTSNHCAGQTVTFADNSLNTVSSRTWIFEGGTPASSSLASPTVVYNTPGTYDVTLIVTNPEGNNTLVVNDGITILTIPSLENTTSSINNEILTYQYNGPLTSNPTWTLPNNTVISSPIATFMAPQNGTYVANLNLYNICGSRDTAISYTVDAYPVAAISSNTSTACIGELVTLSTQAVPNATYTWTINSFPPVTTDVPSYTLSFTEKSIYSVQVVVTNSLGSATDVLATSINVLGRPSASFVANYNGISLSLVNNSADAEQVLWNFGDGNTSTEIAPTYQFQSNGTYTVTLIVTNRCGADTSETTLDVTVLVPAIMFSQSSSAGCAPLQVEITDMSTNDPTSYLWIFEGGNPATSIDKNPVVTYNTPGIFPITVEVTNAAGTTTKTFANSVSVNTTPTADFTFTIQDGEATFTENAIGESDYLWDFGDGTTSIEKSPKHTYSRSDTFAVTLIVTNECGKDTIIKSVAIKLTGLESLTVTPFSISPNPFTNQLILQGEWNRQTKAIVTVMDVTGRTVYQTMIDGSNKVYHEIDATNWPSGSYQLRIMASGQATNMKVIKI